MREKQRAAGLKPRYDGRWRNSTQTPPKDIKPVVRFKNPQNGYVVFEDLVKGKITVANSELDDLVILRSDGIPTYNFGVVLDDLDMNISHVIRGDDHINNTPRQINILKAIEAPLPQYAHVPMILGADGERLSKRHGAVSVMQYHEDGYLPDAMINYLARLGWSHGDEETFSREQLVDWFDLASINNSPARFNPEKLSWLNQHYLKTVDAARLITLVKPFLERNHFVFVGNFLHKPNVDAVLQLKFIWKNIKNKLPQAEIHVYGAYANQQIEQLHNKKEGFLIKGFADDAQQVVKNAKVVLAPIRFGAGIKGKLTEAMLCGTPSVTTSIGAEGMHDGFDWNGFVIDDLNEFSEKAIQLYSDEKLWKKSQENGVEIINTIYDRKKIETPFVKQIIETRKNLETHRTQNFFGSLLQHQSLQATKYMSKWIEEKNK